MYILLNNYAFHLFSPLTTTVERIDERSCTAHASNCAWKKIMVCIANRVPPCISSLRSHFLFDTCPWLQCPPDMDINTHLPSLSQTQADQRTTERRNWLSRYHRHCKDIFWWMYNDRSNTNHWFIPVVHTNQWFIRVWQIRIYIYTYIIYIYIYKDWHMKSSPTKTILSGSFGDHKLKANP